jgi:hypothetical protein
MVVWWWCWPVGATIKQGVHGTGEGWNPMDRRASEWVVRCPMSLTMVSDRMGANSGDESTLNRTATHYFSSEASSRSAILDGDTAGMSARVVDCEIARRTSKLRGRNLGRRA